MPDELIQIKASAPARILMILAILLALCASWFVVRWYLGNTMAEYFLPEESNLDTAQMAISLAPGDPLPHWRLGDLIYKKLPPDKIPLAVAEYEKAVRLSPNDYRFWMVWGLALEHAGEPDKAEKALREAVRLAPFYAYPRWHLGNLLLRRNRYPEAFAELRRASEANGELLPQLFNVAWQINSDDFESLKSAIGQTPVARAQFSVYLIQRSRIAEGLRLWNTLTEVEKRSNRSAADSIIASLIAAKRYHEAIKIWNEIAPGPAYQAEPGRIVDPGFERNIAHGAGMVFGWQVPSLNQVQIGITPNMGHSGSRSLRIFFQVRSRLDAIKVTQLVPVHPGTQYDFEAYVKTEKLVSAGTPIVVITDAADESQLAASEMAATGNNDWQRISLSFKTGPKSEALRLNIIRSSCEADNAVCPIFGTVWYDDFDLKPRK
jgi:hypothetical protein